MRKSIFFILIICLALVTACKNNSEQEAIKSKVEQLFSKQESIYGKEPDTQLFSKTLVEEIKNVQKTTKLDKERIKNSDSPSDKPAMLEGSVFTSLFDGYSKYSVSEVLIKGNIAEVTVNFEYNSTPKEEWTDKVFLINENGWKIDNILFLGKNVSHKNLKERLNSVKFSN